MSTVDARYLYTCLIPARCSVCGSWFRWGSLERECKMSGLVVSASHISSPSADWYRVGSIFLHWLLVQATWYPAFTGVAACLQFSMPCACSRSFIYCKCPREIAPSSPSRSISMPKKRFSEPLSTHSNDFEILDLILSRSSFDWQATRMSSTYTRISERLPLPVCF